MIVGERIGERIKACGISQSALARQVKLSQSTINGLIHGDQTSSTKLHEIARVLKTTPAYLTGETSDPDSDVPDFGTFTAEEHDWVELLRNVAPKDRAAILQLARTIATSAASPMLQGHKLEFRGQ